MKDILVGIDIGSTTTKVIALDAQTKEVLYQSYERHHADQKESVCIGLDKLKEAIGDVPIHVAFTGSGSKPIAQATDLSFVQEVVANSIALKRLYSTVGTAIELGGQDAKIIFFDQKDADDLRVKDMRMNGSCAGGTGAFIDEVASILEIPVTDYENMASLGDVIYDISGRCGVYAKTDIQPLLNEGIRKEDIALSAFYAIVKQTIGGLAQGMDIKKPVAFLGGPLSFHPTLVHAFCDKLDLDDNDVLIPERPELTVVYGAALSLESLFQNQTQSIVISEIISTLKDVEIKNMVDEVLSEPYFNSKEELELFKKHHVLKNEEPEVTVHDCVLPVYLGIDSGSTTTKFVLLDENEEVVDSFYAANEGEPLIVAKNALLDMKKKFEQRNVTLQILGVGTTGYGELLFDKAFQADSHVVETVAHAKAASKYEKDVDFILDIGGQDMKAIWMDKGVITNIVVNEACSSGCGSFLENFASTLDIPVKEIANRAFASNNPANLGSRCTVFMNSNIITEQRNGKTSDDIMAGLCRSIIENVFTKVIRINNLDALGNKIVVQGGTFRNDAVLRAMEQRLNKEVVRAPYPGLMGAIGVALLVKEEKEEKPSDSSFIGFDKLETFTYIQETNNPCPFCTNHCKRIMIHFSTGETFVTNNRCEKGEVLTDIKDTQTKERIAQINKEKSSRINMFDTREKLMFKEYPYELVDSKKEITIGLPRVLNFWDSMPFWQTFWKALGFNVKISKNSTREMYEEGLHAVPSDTECFPAKLVHGHLRQLARMGVDRIFMPSITNMPSENKESTSQFMCALVKGYPIVIRNSDHPKTYSDVIFDSPLFHWYVQNDRDKQLSKWVEETFGIDKKKVLKAIEQGDRAQNTFLSTMEEKGQEVIDKVKAEGRYAIVLASRPYHNDSLVNHELPELINRFGVDVLTVDSIPGLREVDLMQSRIDIVNNYHGRMLSSAILAAENEHLEYVQLVSFGCGHDAYLSDEIIRMMHEISNKVPLVLKLDESDVQGPMRIRVRSFIETINMRRKNGVKQENHSLTQPFEVKFNKEDKEDTLVLIPNTSHAFSQIMSAAMNTDHLHTVSLPVGRERAIYLGKKYVHNDICFPAQITIGEILAGLESDEFKDKKVAVGMGRYLSCCRLTHYSALLRKAMDEAGFEDVPIVTNDDVDSHEMHPGYKMGLLPSVRLAFALPMIDALEEILRKVRPYELVKGSSDEAFERAMDVLCQGIEDGLFATEKAFKQCIQIMKEVQYDRSTLKPTVLIVGEYLLNFHKGANHDIEDYLEKNGFEIIEAKMSDVIQKTYFTFDEQVKDFDIEKSATQKIWLRTVQKVFDYSHHVTNKIARNHELYEDADCLKDMVKDSDEVIYHTFDSGEGVLIPAEILHNAKKGCKAFIILQPFGCLPNHVVGRGISKRLKEMVPDAQILSLDFDPDVSMANIENRLQMLIMNQSQA